MNVGKQSVELLPRGRRVALALLAAILLTLLVTARMLTPDVHGRGTHEQLGLPPCAFSVLFHRPCPACGMTTSWAWLLRGNVRKALAANAGGALLAMVGMMAVPWLLVSAIRGWWFAWTPSDWATVSIGCTIGLVIALQWGWRLILFQS